MTFWNSVMMASLAVLAFLFFVYLAIKLTPRRQKRSIEVTTPQTSQTNSTLNELINEDSDGDFIIMPELGDFFPEEDLEENEE
jgi:uncharacterized protein YpmS